MKIFYLMGEFNISFGTRILFSQCLTSTFKYGILNGVSHRKGGGKRLTRGLLLLIRFICLPLGTQWIHTSFIIRYLY